MMIALLEFELFLCIVVCCYCRLEEHKVGVRLGDDNRGNGHVIS